jgi:hypothetical protein
MKGSALSISLIGLLVVLAACQGSAPQKKIDPATLAERNTAWTLIGNKDMDETGVLLAIAALGAKTEMMAWFAKNEGCVQFGQFRNEVAAAMEDNTDPTDDQIKEAEANAMAMMSAADRAALKAHCDTMGDEAGGALVKCAAAVAAAGKLKTTLQGAKSSITGNMLEKAKKGKMFLDGLGQVADMVTFLNDTQSVINQWKASYEEWGNAVEEI